MEEILSLERLYSRNTGRLRDNSQRAQSLILVFWIFIAINVLAVISDYMELQLLKKVYFGGLVTDETASASDDRQGVIGLVQVLIYGVCVIVFLRWFRRAYGNLKRLGVRLQFKEGMAIYSWIIPIVCLFWPLQIMKETWGKTQRLIKKRDPLYNIRSGSLAIGTWWLLYMFSNFIGRYLFKSAWNPEPPLDFIAQTEAYLISDLLEIPQALLVIFIVSRISGMERKLAEEVEKTENYS